MPHKCKYLYIHLVHLPTLLSLDIYAYIKAEWKYHIIIFNNPLSSYNKERVHYYFCLQFFMNNNIVVCWKRYVCDNFLFNSDIYLLAARELSIPIFMYVLYTDYTLVLKDLSCLHTVLHSYDGRTSNPSGSLCTIYTWYIHTYTNHI